MPDGPVARVEASPKAPVEVRGTVAEVVKEASELRPFVNTRPREWDLEGDPDAKRTSDFIRELYVRTGRSEMEFEADLMKAMSQPYERVASAVKCVLLKIARQKHVDDAIRLLWKFIWHGGPLEQGAVANWDEVLSLVEQAKRPRDRGARPRPKAGEIVEHVCAKPVPRQPVLGLTPERISELWGQIEAETQH